MIIDSTNQSGVFEFLTVVTDTRGNTSEQVSKVIISSIDDDLNEEGIPSSNGIFDSWLLNKVSFSKMAGITTSNSIGFISNKTKTDQLGCGRKGGGGFGVRISFGMMTGRAIFIKTPVLLGYFGNRKKVIWITMSTISKRNNGCSCSLDIYLDCQTLLFDFQFLKEKFYFFENTGKIKGISLSQ